MPTRMPRMALSLLLPLALAGAGCSSSSTTPDAKVSVGDGGAGGPVSGPADDHCGGKKQEVDPAACKKGPPDGGAEGGDGGAEEEPPVNFNAEADDDDCKYHLSFTSTDIILNKDVYFTVKATTLTDGKPASWGAEDTIEAFTEDKTHPAPDTVKAPVQSTTGTMKFGPLRFDRSGKWVVRFHIHEECEDFDEASQHGHGAFFINVP
jgi:hypothetical protein